MADRSGMDESGCRLVHKKLPCDLATILQLLESYKESIATIAVESTYNWYWLVDGLPDHGYHVVLANPARMQPYSGMKYTDDVSDAYFLAELLRLNRLPTGHLYDRKTTPRARPAAPPATAGAPAHHADLEFQEPQ